jgi:hypothetical protein
VKFAFEIKTRAHLLMVVDSSRVIAAGAATLPFDVLPNFRAQVNAITPSWPAQHDNFATSLAKPSAASFRPSTVVKYGKIVSARSSTVRFCRIASGAA